MLVRPQTEPVEDVVDAGTRRERSRDFDKGGAGTEAYVALAVDYYEVANAFPTGAGIDDIYDWVGLWTYR